MGQNVRWRHRPGRVDDPSASFRVYMRYRAYPPATRETLYAADPLNAIPEVVAKSVGSGRDGRLSRTLFVAEARKNNRPDKSRTLKLNSILPTK